MKPVAAAASPLSRASLDLLHLSAKPAGVSAIAQAPFLILAGSSSRQDA
jgi:hypothetical protein